MLYILIIGAIVGLFTSFGQTYLPEPFKQLANSYSVWLFGSFILGTIIATHSWAAFGGAAVQYLAIIIYSLLSFVRFESGFSLSSSLVWIIGGTILGPICALSGIEVKRQLKYQPYAIAFMAALFFSESLYQFISLHYYGEGYCFLALGLIFSTIALIKRSQKRLVTALILPLSLIMFAGYAVVLPMIMGS